MTEPRETGAFPDGNAVDDPLNPGGPGTAADAAAKADPMRDDSAADALESVVPGSEEDLPDDVAPDRVDGER